MRRGTIELKIPTSQDCQFERDYCYIHQQNACHGPTLYLPTLTSVLWFRNDLQFASNEKRPLPTHCGKGFQIDYHKEPPFWPYSCYCNCCFIAMIREHNRISERTIECSFCGQYDTECFPDSNVCIGCLNKDIEKKVLFKHELHQELEQRKNGQRHSAFPTDFPEHVVVTRYQRSTDTYTDSLQIYACYEGVDSSINLA